MKPNREDEIEVIQSRAVEPMFYRAPAPPDRKPKEYQLAGVEYAFQRKHCLIGDAPGLGKTAEAIMLSNAEESQRTLVICPASLRLNWEREVWNWSMIENVTTYPVLKSSDGISHQANYVILSYDLLRNPSILGALLALRWDHLVLDEAHYLKDPNGNARTIPICAPDCLPRVVGRITMLSGTILPNQPIECFGSDTLVLTDRGWKSIVSVGINDLLWDGEAWVGHDGLVYRGERETISLAGVNLTPEHPLAGDSGRWFPAEQVGRRESIFRRVLAKGSENLPSLASIEGHGGASELYGYSAPVEHLDIVRPRGIYGGGYGGVDPVERARARVDILAFVQMISSARAFLCSLATFFSDAKIQKILTTVRTGVEACAFTRRGFEIAAHFWPISYLYLAIESPAFSLIDGTTTGDMSPEISALSPVSKTQGTAESSTRCSNGSTGLRPVYDLVNAGPRQRFTILSNRGPMIAHNCYNAVKLLDWDAIDRMSIDAFRNEYYDEGGGMVRGPVLVTHDEDGNPFKGGPHWESRVHWSDTVRNVPVNLDDLQYRLRKHIMVRRLKEQCLHELPAKQWHPFPLAITPDMRRAMKHPGWAEAEKLYQMDAHAFDHGVPVDGAISTARRLLGEAKAPAVADYIEELLSEGVECVVVGAWHHTVLTLLRDRLSKYGLVYMDGATSSKRKQAAVDQFQGDDRIRIILGQTQTIGEGWTLTRAQDVVLAEPDWVPGRNDQLLDRTHRLGQTGNVIGHVPVVPGTLDEKILGTAIKKDQHIYNALDARL